MIYQFIIYFSICFVQCFFLVWHNVILSLAAKKNGQDVQFQANDTPIPALSAETANQHVQSEIKYLQGRIFTQYRPEINAVLFDASELAEIRTIIADDVEECIVDDIFIMPAPEENPLGTTSGEYLDPMEWSGNVPVSPGREANQTMFGQLVSYSKISGDHEMSVIRESVGMQSNLSAGKKVSTHDSEMQNLTNTEIEMIATIDGKSQPRKIQHQEQQSNPVQLGYKESNTENQNVVNRSARDDNNVSGVSRLEQLTSSNPNSTDRPQLEDVVSGDIQYEENVSEHHQIFS